MTDSVTSKIDLASIRRGWRAEYEEGRVIHQLADEIERLIARVAELGVKVALMLPVVQAADHLDSCISEFGIDGSSTCAEAAGLLNDELAVYHDETRIGAGGLPATKAPALPPRCPICGGDGYHKPQCEGGETEAPLARRHADWCNVGKVGANGLWMACNCGIPFRDTLSENSP